MAAKQDVLAELHALLAQQMIDELNWYKANDIPVPAADKAAIAKFLKDNAITCDPADASDIERLRAEFQASSEARRNNALRLVANTKESVAALYGEVVGE